MAVAPSRFSLLRNSITIFGAAVTTSGALLFLTFFFIELLGYQSNPYVGLLFLIVFPALFVTGLVIMPAGVWLERRRRAGDPDKWRIRWPTIDLKESWVRRSSAVFLLCSAANVVIVSLAAFSGVHYMDSAEFCGQLCHEVMEPEWAGYQEGPHSRVACVQCHIGAGAPWFVKSKLSGLRQVYAVTFNTHSRPIPSPVTDLRPARDTCEQCHWPDKFHGDKIRVIREYAEDEANSESTTTLRMHIGGVSVARGLATGIHWHVSEANRIEYVATDEKRQVIPYVRLDDGRGNVTEYFADGLTEIPQGERRTLDCVDCHNRPSHTFASSAERAVDEALALNDIDAGLPFIKREAVRVLKAEYPSATAAQAGIADGLTRYYREQQPRASQAAVKQAIATVQRLYRRNVFPSMSVSWGTHINNIGHVAFPGCFRCHDDRHASAAGQTITQDCSLCHTIE
ncbi:MAG: NapC/NirT family cytochrome c [Acidobacteriota bacterium]